MLALHQATQLAYRDRQLTAANEQTERLVYQVDGLTIERDDALNAWEEATARLAEANADLANAQAISSPAPVDLDDTVPIPMPKVIPLRFAFAPAEQVA
jgi:beta-xylosidase